MQHRGCQRQLRAPSPTTGSFVLHPARLGPGRQYLIRMSIQKDKAHLANAASELASTSSERIGIYSRGSPGRNLIYSANQYVHTFHVFCLYWDPITRPTESFIGGEYGTHARAPRAPHPIGLSLYLVLYLSAAAYHNKGTGPI